MNKKDEDLLLFLDDFIQANGYAPSYTEIMSGTTDKSKNGVNIRLNRLEDAGYIKRVPSVARSIQVLNSPSRAHSPGT